MYGHQIKETIDQHLEAFSDLKRANLYYLLDRMVHQGYLEARMQALEPGDANGDNRQVERRVFHITDAGRKRFRDLLRSVLGTVGSFNSPVDIAIFFLPHLPKQEALELLAARRQQIWEQYQRSLAHMQAHPGMSDLHDITTDHVISLYQLELSWLDRARERIEKSPALKTA